MTAGKRLRGGLAAYSPLLLGVLMLIVLVFLPTGYEDAVIYRESIPCRVTILEVDNEAIVSAGLIQSGEQFCKIRIEEGIFKGEETTGYNLLSGSLEADKIFSIGDSALGVVSHSDGTILSVNLMDHYRLDKMAILGILFAVFLILFAGRKGVQSIMSFFITILSIWKILIPLCLKGYNPIYASLILVAVLTFIIIVFVYGFDRRSLTAILGSMLGVIACCIMGIIGTSQFKIHGAVLSNSTSLLYSGYQDLNLTQLFMSSIFIGASGAMMDLSVDITSAVHEVVEKKPEIGRLEAIQSGMHIGRAAMGTMTTTLLLAYTGGYIAQLMTFMAQGTPVYNILNYKYMAAEILETVVGSFGLVLVAPFTAIVAGCLLTHRKQTE
ncbi:MAG: YibE/F family protein [Lachnospiraceae bacterium]|nr:YibE/F family protein [Lachnospiraceae bacterium]